LPEDSSHEKISPEAEDSSPEYSSLGYFFARKAGKFFARMILRRKVFRSDDSSLENSSLEKLPGDGKSSPDYSSLGNFSKKQTKIQLMLHLAALWETFQNLKWPFLQTKRFSLNIFFSQIEFQIDFQIEFQLNFCLFVEEFF
jgi:hypothetical protein